MKFNEMISGKKEFKMAFLGGSITYGEGASKKELRYSSRFTKVLNDFIPQTSFIEINAGVGGTPSALGLYRLQKEVLDKEPDILFVEFSVNDNGDIDTYLKYFEGITRAARKYNPNLPIMYLNTYKKKGMYEGTTRENPTRIVREHKKISEKYGIPTVDMGYDLHEKVLAYLDNETVYTKDGVHPNDDGYRVYVDSMMRDVFNADFGFDYPAAPVTGYEFNDPKMILLQDTELEQGWAHSVRGYYADDYHYIYSDEPGKELNFSFEGTACALYYRIELGGGIMHAYVDGKFVRDIYFWDSYALQSGRQGFSIITDGLEFGKHDVKLVISEDKQQYSEGHVARIVAYLVG